MAPGVVSVPALSPRGRAAVARLMAAVARLMALCNAHEGLDLKLDLDAAPSGPDGTEANHLLCYAGDHLIGYCALDTGDPIELCGMVHPAHRRHGVGHALLAAATVACRRRGHTRAYLVCEDASASGQAFVAASGAIYRFAEHRMELATRPPRPPGDAGLHLHRASRDDIGTLARVQAATFAESEDERRRRIIEEIDNAHVRFYLARLHGTPVGSLKLLVADGRASIYAFGVVPDYRRRGLGRQILDGIVDLLHAEGQTRIGLEVESDNTPALALYRARGFHVATTYGYYELDLP